MDLPSWLGGKKNKRKVPSPTAGSRSSGTAAASGHTAAATATTTASAAPQAPATDDDATTSRRGSFFRSGTSVADVTGPQGDPVDAPPADTQLDAEAIAALVLEVDAAVKAFHAPPPMSRESRWALAAVCAVSLGGMPRTHVLHTWLVGFVQQLARSYLKLDAAGYVRTCAPVLLCCRAATLMCHALVVLC